MTEVESTLVQIRVQVSRTQRAFSTLEREAAMLRQLADQLDVALKEAHGAVVGRLPSTDPAKRPP